jgi:hypothetical protein
MYRRGLKKVFWKKRGKQKENDKDGRHMQESAEVKGREKTARRERGTKSGGAGLGGGGGGRREIGADEEGRNEREGKKEERQGATERSRMERVTT